MIKAWRKLALHWKIIVALALGIIWSLIAGYDKDLLDFTVDWISPWGDIFIRILKFIAIPLVLFSIISGITGMKDISKLGRLGGKTILIYVTTTMTAVIIGLLLVNAVQPGKSESAEKIKKNRVKYELWAQSKNIDTKDGEWLIKDPANSELIEEVQDLQKSEAQSESFKQDQEKVQELEEKKKASEEQGPLGFLVNMIPENIILSLGDGKLMLQVIVFAIFFGITILTIDRKKTQPVIDFVDGTNEVFVQMVHIAMRAAPFFVFCLMAGVITKMADSTVEMIGIFKSLGMYSITVLIGLAFMIFIFYPLVVKIFVRKIPYREFFRRISPAQFLAFSTSSSAATLPVTIECVEERIGVSKNVSGFVLPIGATVNMDGTSLYQAIGVIFLAQMHGVGLTLDQQLIIVLTATLASIGAAAVPSAGLVMLMVVLESVGLNPAWIAIIFPVDRILDMCRTVVNVTGDSAVATLVAHSENELNYKEEFTEPIT